MIQLPGALLAVLLLGAAAVSGLAVYVFFLLQRRSREVETLHEVAETLSSHPPQTQAALSAIVAIVARYLEADLVAFMLLDEATGDLVSQPGGYGLDSEEMHYRIPLSEEQSSSVQVFKTGRPYITGDAQNDPKVLSRYARLWRIHSLLVIPVKLEGRSIGVLRAGSFKRDYFTREHLEMMSVIADETAVIVETAILNRRLMETTQQLRAADRMKDDFVSTVSHEFKTPLTTITGFLGVMLDGETGRLTEQQTKFLTVSMNAAKRLGVLVTELLDLSKLEGGVAMEMGPLALDKMVVAGVESHRPQARERALALSCETPGFLPPVRGDGKWVGVVIDNLLTNALKYTPPGGRIQVSLSNKGEFLMVCVSDSGIGIPSEDKAHIFEKFFRARNNTEIGAPGTGLGLAISKEIISKHGGRIWFETEPGRGSKFYFILPAMVHEEAAESA